MEATSASLMTFGLAALLASWVLLMIVAWKEDYAWGLFTLLLPPLSYIYGLTRLDKAGQAWLLAIVGLLVLVYTAAGGLWAVVVTDMVQLVLALAGATAVALAAVHAAGGMDALLASLRALERPELLSLVPWQLQDGQLRWIDSAGIRWGLDATHRAQIGAGDWEQNSWACGLDRLLAEVRMLPAGGMLFSVFAGWCLSTDAAREELGMTQAWFSVWRFLVRFVAPIAVGAVFVSQLT